MVIVQALLLGLGVFLLAKAIHGEIAGLLALGFFAFSPNMLAHGALITPDMTLSMTCFATMALFRLALIHDTRKFHVLSGVALGLALLSKFPALLLLPVEAAALGVLALRGQRVPIKGLLLSWACAAGVLLLGYGFDPQPYLQGLAIRGSAPGHWSYLMGELSSE
jgi:4-amino-4-deoxy-L-arabinose transferase-like glycosyltransferase